MTLTELKTKHPKAGLLYCGASSQPIVATNLLNKLQKLFPEASERYSNLPKKVIFAVDSPRRSWDESAQLAGIITDREYPAILGDVTCADPVTTQLCSLLSCLDEDKEAYHKKEVTKMYRLLGLTPSKELSNPAKVGKALDEAFGYGDSDPKLIAHRTPIYQAIGEGIFHQLSKYGVLGISHGENGSQYFIDESKIIGMVHLPQFLENEDFAYDAPTAMFQVGVLSDGDITGEHVVKSLSDDKILDFDVNTILLPDLEIG